MESKKLDPEFKRKWVDALRSGEYRQGRLALRNADGAYCCLGIACVAAGLEFVQEGSGSFRLKHTRSEKGEDILPDRFRKKIGLSPREQKRLYGMNDDEGKSFAEIADYIEQNL